MKEMPDIRLSTIKSNPNNPRIIKDEKFHKLVKSLKKTPEFMELRPIIVDENKITLGGNMRLKALKELGYKKIPREWVKVARGLKEEQKREFIIKDNVGYGEWDWDILGNEWNSVELEEWGVDSWRNMDDIDTSDSFDLPEGDKPPFRQLTFIVADKQSEAIITAISEIKQSHDYKDHVDYYGNDNANGNALYLIINQWEEQKK